MSRVLGMRAASTAGPQGVQAYRGRGKLSKARPKVLFRPLFCPKRERSARRRAPRKKRVDSGSVVEVVPAAVIHASHSTHSPHAAHSSHSTHAATTGRSPGG